MRDLKFCYLGGGSVADSHVVHSDGQGDGEGDSNGDIPFILLIPPTKVNFSYKTHTILIDFMTSVNPLHCLTQ